jgi:three-Cys-motif partner protein
MDEWEAVPLFPPPMEQSPAARRRTPTRDERLWTGNKALLIQWDLYYFTIVTRRGTYVDGFAGPHATENPDSWAARLALELQPPRLRHFHLFELRTEKIRALIELKTQNEMPGRSIGVYHGDFNIEVDRILRPETITASEPTFVLLDQYTFQCHWRTVKKLARYRTEGYKLELFYFLAEAWLDRSISAIKTAKGFEMITAWWGGTGYGVLKDVRGMPRAELLAARFTDELGYTYVTPYAIYSRRGGGRLMYFMIHASDHPEAPSFMDRAYEKAVLPRDPQEQLRLGI